MLKARLNFFPFINPPLSLTHPTPPPVHIYKGHVFLNFISVLNVMTWILICGN